MFDQPVCRFFCEFHACAYGHFEVYAQTAVVGGRKELAADLTHQHQGSEEDAHADDECRHLMSHYPFEQASVAAVESVESAVNRSKENGVKAAVTVVAAKQQRAEHGGQGQGADGGDDHHDCDHPSQLAEEDAGHAGDEWGRIRL